MHFRLRFGWPLINCQQFTAAGQLHHHPNYAHLLRTGFVMLDLKSCWCCLRSSVKCKLFVNKCNEYFLINKCLWLSVIFSLNACCRDHLKYTLPLVPKMLHDRFKHISLHMKCLWILLIAHILHSLWCQNVKMHQKYTSTKQFVSSYWAGVTNMRCWCTLTLKTPN